MKRSFAFIFLIISVTATFGQQAIKQAIKVDKNGDGRPVLLLPGFTSPGSVWDGTVRSFNSNYETHAVSYAGFGELAAIDTPWYDQVRDQLIEYIKKENFSNLVIIGHSMGGNLAIDLAGSFPERVRGLVLVESIPCMRELMMPNASAVSIQYESPYNRQVLEMSDDVFRQMVQGISQNMTTDPSKIELLTSWSLQADRRTYVYGYTDLLKLDLRDTLKNISIRTLILGASFPDKNVILANYEKQYANLASKEILIADNCRHFIMFDQPEWLQHNINRYLQANARN